MKRVLRVVVLGPLMLLILLCITAVWPISVFVDWLTENQHGRKPGDLSAFWAEVLREVWG